jgi:hypothetical protein
MRNTLLTLALCLSTCPLTAFGQSQARDAIPVMSFDDTSCGAWSRSQNTAQLREVYLFWIRGFVSGFNHGSRQYQVQLGAMPDNDTLALYVDTFCRENPLSPFIGAAFKLVETQRVKLAK